jgi:hypothetical protein
MKIAAEFIKYSIAGFAAAPTHLAVLAGLVQLMQAPKPMASARLLLRHSSLKGAIPLPRGSQRSLETLPMDRRSRQNHRRS